MKLKFLFTLLVAMVSLSFAGGDPWLYFAPYETDVESALQKLRMREFNAGRYYPVVFELDFPVDSNSEAPGKKHASISAVFKDAEETGARSILDIFNTCDSADYSCAYLLSEEIIRGMYGTNYPTHEMVMKNTGFYDDLERGHCIYFIVYQEKEPVEIVFAGYTYD